MLKTNSRTPRLARRRARLRRGRDPLPQAGMAAVVQRARDRRPGLHAALHPQPVARGRALVLGPRGALRHAGGRQRRSSCSGSWSAINYLGVAAQQALGPDGGASSSRCRTRPRRSCRACRSRSRSGCSRRPTTSTRFRDRLDEYQYALEAGDGRVHRRRQASGAGAAVPGAAARHGRLRVRRPHRARHLRRRAGADQRPDQGRSRDGSTRSTSSRATARRTPTARTATATATIAAGARRRTTSPSTSSCSRSRRRCRPTRRSLIIAGPKTDFFPPEIDMLKAYLARGGKVFVHARSAGRRPDSRELTNLIALLKEWGIEAGNNVVVDVSGMGQLLGTGPEVPVAAKYQPHPITERFNLLTAYPLARSVRPSTGRRQRPVRAERSSRPARAAGPRPTSRTLDDVGQVGARLDKGDKAGPGLARRGGLGRRRRPRRPAPPQTRQARGRAEAARRASSCSATRTSRPTRCARHPGQPRSVPERGELARAAGEPDLDPAEGSRGPPHHADRATRSAASSG